MTLFLDFRTHGDGGAILSPPRIYDAATGGGGDNRGKHLNAVPAENHEGKHLVLAAHGFNVSRADGIACLTKLEQMLNLGPDYAFIGVLWPGSWHHIVINYPGEGRDAAKTGDHLAAFIDKSLGLAESVSFLSHSLGGRVVLQTVRTMKVRAREVCVTAGAVDSRCVAPGQAYDACRRNASRITVLHSESDNALGAVYSAGTLAGGLLHLDDHPFGTALGLRGSNPRALAAISNSRIPEDQEHDHGDYFPSSKPGTTNGRVDRSVAIMARAIRGEAVAWPHRNRIDR